MNKIAQSNLKVKTPFKKSKSKSALKGGRSINHASISAKTPSTAESTNGKKMLIKRLAIEKVRNLCAETSLSTPDSQQCSAYTSMCNNSNMHSTQNIEFHGMIYGTPHTKIEKVLKNHCKPALLTLNKRIVVNKRKSEFEENSIDILKSINKFVPLGSEFIHVKNDIYKYANKYVSIEKSNGKYLIRSGGGTVPLEEFIKINRRNEKKAVIISSDFQFKRKKKKPQVRKIKLIDYDTKVVLNSENTV